MRRSNTYLFVIILVLALLFSNLSIPRPAQAAGTISLAAFGTTYTQDFNTLASSGTSSMLPTGWEFYETGSNANINFNSRYGFEHHG